METQTQQGEWWNVNGFQYFVGADAKRYEIVWNNEILDVVIPDGATAVIGMFRGSDYNFLINEPGQVRQILDAIKSNTDYQVQ